jgi:DNA-binding transcriptional ArsR family regulator
VTRGRAGPIGKERESCSYLHNLGSIIQYVDKSPSPSLLPILRSQQQAELLALLLGDDELELSLTELAARLEMPFASVHREVERAEAAGLITSRKVGNTRLVRANTRSPYYTGLADVLTRAFGVPAVLSEALRGVPGLSAAYVFGSWAARFQGEAGRTPVNDIDVLVLGAPDRDALFAQIPRAEERLGRPVQVTIRPADWLEAGEGSFHATVTSRPLVSIDLSASPSAR